VTLIIIYIVAMLVSFTAALAALAINNPWRGTAWFIDVTRKQYSFGFPGFLWIAVTVLSREEGERSSLKQQMNPGTIRHRRICILNKTIDILYVRSGKAGLRQYEESW